MPSLHLEQDFGPPHSSLGEQDVAQVISRIGKVAIDVFHASLGLS